MKRWIPILSLLLAAQIGGALWLAGRGDPLAAARPDTPLVKADVTRADRLLIAGPKGERVELKARDGHWLLPGYFDAPVKDGRVPALLKRLAAVRLGYPVATTAEARKRFKVAEGGFERRIELYRGEERLARVWLGSSSGVRNTYVRPEGEEAVYRVALAAWDFPTQPARWLDQDLLQGDVRGLTAIDLGGGLRLLAKKEKAKGKEKKDGRRWRAEGLKAGEHLKKGAAEALVNTLEGLRVDAVLGTKARPGWGQDAPLRTLTLESEAGKVTWTLSKENEKDKDQDRYVLKTSSRPWYFRLETWNAKPLLDASARKALIEPPPRPQPSSPGADAAEGGQDPGKQGAPAP